MTEQQAIERLTRAGFCPGITYTIDLASGRERVVEQAPAAGARAPSGATVRIGVVVSQSAAIVRWVGACPSIFRLGSGTAVSSR